SHHHFDGHNHWAHKRRNRRHRRRERKHRRQRPVRDCRAHSDNFSTRRQRWQRWVYRWWNCDGDERDPYACAPHDRPHGATCVPVQPHHRSTTRSALPAPDDEIVAWVLPDGPGLERGQHLQHTGAVAVERWWPDRAVPSTTRRLLHGGPGWRLALVDHSHDTVYGPVQRRRWCRHHAPC